MLDVAIRKPDGSVTVDLGSRAAPPLPVVPALAPILPDGLRRGSVVTVTGSISLLFALLGGASRDGAWCALVGFPRLSAEAADEYGIDLSRMAIVLPSGGGTVAQLAPSSTGWTTAVGALLEAVDIVAARPQRITAGDVRRLAARARTRDAVLMPFLTGNTRADTAEWPGADMRLSVRDSQWAGIGVGTGRLRGRRVGITAEGRGQAARPRSASLWLPAVGGGVDTAEPLAPVVDLAG